MRVQRVLILVTVSVAIVAVASAVALAARSGSAATTPKRGGSITIARIEDSQSFDKTNVFQNESIWITEQINETLYTSGPDGKT